MLGAAAFLSDTVFANHIVLFILASIEHFAIEASIFVFTVYCFCKTAFYANFGFFSVNLSITGVSRFITSTAVTQSCEKPV